MMSISSYSKWFTAVAPGRVNLLGEHVDYNEGMVLPVAIDRKVFIHAAPLEEQVVNLKAADFNQETSFNLSDLEQKVDIHGAPLPAWALYPAGVAWALGDLGVALPGITAVYHSNIPIGAGLSSSAAVEIGFASLWQAICSLHFDHMQMAKICRRAEVDYVGVNCGLMDQFASSHGVAGHALYFDTRTLDWEAIPIPPQTTLVVTDSGVARRLSESAYNQRRTTCEQAVLLLQPLIPGIRALRDVTEADFQRTAQLLPETMRKRVQHVVQECVRVKKAAAVLKAGKIEEFGEFMLEGHASLRDLFEVSCPELDALVEIASRQPGCWGARLTGAGFGGSTINLVQRDMLDAFAATLKKEYREGFSRELKVHICQAERGAHIVSPHSPTVHPRLIGPEPKFT